MPWRFIQFVIGFIGGIVVLVVIFLIYAVVSSETRAVERAAGWKLPARTSFDYEQTESDLAAGWRKTLRGFFIEDKAGNALMTNCPAGFTRGKLADSGIPEPNVEEQQKPVCFLRKTSGKREDIVAIKDDRVLHFRIDR